MKSNNLFNVLMYTAVGIAIGAVVCTLSLLAVHGMTDVLRELTVWLIASAVLGLVSMVYESEHFTVTIIDCHMTGIADYITCSCLGKAAYRFSKASPTG